MYDRMLNILIKLNLYNKYLYHESFVRFINSRPNLILYRGTFFYLSAEEEMFMVKLLFKEMLYIMNVLCERNVRMLYILW